VHWLAFVVLVCSPGDAEGVKAVEEVHGQGGNGRTLSAIGQVDGEVPRRIVVGRCSEHGVAFVVNSLASWSEGVTRNRGFIELDMAVFIRLDGEDKLVDLIARLRGELE